MQILIKDAQVIDPGNIMGPKDVLVEDTIIAKVAEPGQAGASDARVIDGRNKILTPGLLDIHVHLREPGHEYKETIETGLKAAAIGGFTAVCCMPNTKPVNDNSQITRFIIDRAREAGYSKVFPAGAITSGSEGTTLAEIYDMKNAGAVAVTDDGRPLENAELMRRALEYCNGLDLPVFVHAEDLSLANHGAMNEGRWSTFWGIPGIPNAAESVMVVRDIALSELTGGRVHFCHISTAESIEAIRQAKKRGARVTCETAPHYFTLADEDVREYDTHFKMNPPLRSEADRQAVIEGLCDNTIDLIASDHAPHSEVEKDLEFDRAAFGIIGLETSLSLSLGLVHSGFLSMEALIEKMAKAPARVIGMDNDIRPGNPADLTLIDPDHELTIDPDTFASKSRNTPFGGRQVRGCAWMTMVDGRVVHQI